MEEYIIEIKLGQKNIKNVYLVKFGRKNKEREELGKFFVRSCWINVKETSF